MYVLTYIHDEQRYIENTNTEKLDEFPGKERIEKDNNVKGKDAFINKVSSRM